MPQQLNQTIRNSFNKGLLTEFSELNFPENASIDELNCNLFKQGNRSKRLGIEYESGYELSDETYIKNRRASIAGIWTNVGGNPNIEFIVVQKGKFLLFYRKTPNALSANPVSISSTNPATYRLNLVDFEAPVSPGAAERYVYTASINGFLVVVSRAINSFYIAYDEDTKSFTATEIAFKVRDFEWQVNNVQSLLSDSTNTPPSVRRQYDTYNAGWNGERGTGSIDVYVGATGFWPPLTSPWYASRGTNYLDYSTWEDTYKGNTLITNGHYILDLFEKNRSEASGIDGLTTEVNNKRFTSVVTFAGRLFYTGIDSKIYFSQILENNNEFGLLYSVNDPTAEDLNSLLDTDGGFIGIPDASNIKKLHVFGSSLLAFANNGVWRITGVDGVFRATEYSVYKVTDSGLAQIKSFASGQNAVPFWWSNNGIHTIQVTDQGGLVEVNLSRDTIQTFWNNIGDARNSVKSCYDALNDRVLWLYPNEGETSEFKVNNILFLDTTIGAFFPWKISDASGETPYIEDCVYIDSASQEVEFTVVDDDGNTVVDNNNNTIVATLPSIVSASTTLKFLTRDSSGSIVFSSFTSIDFTDWGSADYSAYAESAYNFMGDLARQKNTPYITVLSKVTETGWNAVGNGYTPIRNSSLKVSAYWDFKTTPSTEPQQAYRFKYPLIVSNPATFDYPTTVISTRLKPRGRGKVIRLRFEGETGKDFNLLGWETLDARNPSY